MTYQEIVREMLATAELPAVVLFGQPLDHPVLEDSHRIDDRLSRSGALGMS